MSKAYLVTFQELYDSNPVTVKQQIFLSESKAHMAVRKWKKQQNFGHYADVKDIELVK
jgi:hypothetical protein